MLQNVLEQAQQPSDTDHLMSETYSLNVSFAIGAYLRPLSSLDTHMDANSAKDIAVANEPKKARMKP